ncbi:MAG: hypothetical protein PVJ15_02910 [Gammaproteobacteria bacterium]
MLKDIIDGLGCIKVQQISDQQAIEYRGCFIRVAYVILVAADYAFPAVWQALRDLCLAIQGHGPGKFPVQVIVDEVSQRFDGGLAQHTHDGRQFRERPVDITEPIKLVKHWNNGQAAAQLSQDTPGMQGRPQTSLDSLSA